MPEKILWTVEWSESQQCFNVDCLELFLTRNRMEFANPQKGYSNDWSLLAIFDDIHEANKCARFFREQRNIPTLEEKFVREHCQ